MTEKPTLRTKTIHSGAHQGVPFEIHERNSDMDGFEKFWTYYVFLHEKKFTRFAEIWLPPNTSDLKFPTFDYLDTWAAGVEGWNGGVTYYQKHGELAGFRCVEYGCDYQHSWDEGHNYTVTSVLLDAVCTINHLVPFFATDEKA